MLTCSYLCLIFDSHISFSSAIISPSLLCVSTTSVIFALFLTMIQLAPPAHLLFTADLAAAIPCTIVRSQIAFYTSRMFFSNHQSTPVSRSHTAPSGMPHLTCGTSFLLLFVFLIMLILHHHPALFHHHANILDHLSAFLMTLSTLILKLSFPQSFPP